MGRASLSCSCVLSFSCEVLSSIILMPRLPRLKPATLKRKQVSDAGA